jgi:hypothetical protein
MASIIPFPSGYHNAGCRKCLDCIESLATTARDLQDQLLELPIGSTLTAREWIVSSTSARMLSRDLNRGLTALHRSVAVGHGGEPLASGRWSEALTQLGRWIAALDLSFGRLCTEELSTEARLEARQQLAEDAHSLPREVQSLDAELRLWHVGARRP